MADSTYHEAPAQTAAALPVPVPQRLIGRDALLGRVYTRLRENQPVVIYGGPGIGKTALAARLAAAYTEQPGGVLWLSVDHPSMEDLIVRVGRAYREDAITNTEYPLAMVGAVAGALTQHKPLIVLDGRIEDEVLNAFVNRCAAGLPVLIAVPAAPSGDWHAIELPPLEPAQGVSLLLTTAGLPASPDAEQIAAQLRQQPFALTLAGGTIAAARMPLDQYRAALVQMPGADHAEPTLLALTTAFRALSNALQGLLLMMGAGFTRGASADLLSAVSGAPGETIQQAMTLLAGRALVMPGTRYGSPYYRLHELTYTFAQGWLRGSNRLDDLQQKMRDALLTYARTHADAPDRLAAEMDNFLALARWSAEVGDRDTANALLVALTGAGDFIQSRGYVYELIQLRRLTSSRTSAFPAYPSEPAFEAEPEPETPAHAAFMRDMFDDEDDDDLAYEEDEESLADDVSWATADPAESIAAMLETVNADDEDDEEVDEDLDEADPLPVDILDMDDEYEDEDDLDEDVEMAAPFHFSLPIPIDESEEVTAPLEGIAALRASLMRARQAEDARQQAALLRAIGDQQVVDGMENEAIASYDEAAGLYEEMGDRAGLLGVLVILSALMSRTDNTAAAVLNASRGVTLARELGDDPARLSLLTILGDARQQGGDSDEAERAYEEALSLTGDPSGEARLLFKLGYAQLDKGDPEGAVATWEDALARFRALGENTYEGRILGGLGTAYGELAQWSEAIRFHTSALHIARATGDREDEALQLSNLAYACVQGGQLGQAVLNYRQALHLAYESDNRENIVTTIVDLARLLARSGQHLAIARALIDDAEALDPNDRDVRSLKERLAAELRIKQAEGVEQRPFTGTAREYAANAYSLLEM